MSRFAIDALRAFGQAVLLAEGASSHEAQILTDCLMDAQLRTAPFHNQGLIRLAIYVRRIREGGLTPCATVAVIRETASVGLLDGGNGFGQVVAHRAMTMAIEKARAAGVGVVAARNSNHFGTASYFTLMAAGAGLVGLAFTNASPEMPAWGGSVALVGTNPWSIAVPGHAERPIVLDLSNAASGKSAIRHFAAIGRSLPPDWAIDSTGGSVTDPRVAADALLAPMGGYKGYGIAVMADLLTAGLAGGQVGSAVGSPYQFARPQGVSHLVMALDPTSFAGLDALDSAAGTLSRELRQSPRQPTVTATYLPGDPEWERERESRQLGIDLPEETVERLRALGVESGVTFPGPAA
jgi:LDH2 family malate/lactate/ureidoglycolate dehydrogenase